MKCLVLDCFFQKPSWKHLFVLGVSWNFPAQIKNQIKPSFPKPPNFCAPYFHGEGDGLRCRFSDRSPKYENLFFPGIRWRGVLGWGLMRLIPPRIPSIKETNGVKGTRKNGLYIETSLIQAAPMRIRCLIGSGLMYGRLFCQLCQPVAENMLI